jgi:ribosomal protein S14
MGLRPRNKCNLEKEIKVSENTAVTKRRGKCAKCGVDESLINIFCVGRRCYKDIAKHPERQGEFVKVRRENNRGVWYAWIKRGYAEVKL